MAPPGPRPTRASRLRRPRRSTRLALLGLTALTGCLDPTYGYLSEPDAGFALRYPQEWDEVAVDPTGSEWVRAVDAAQPPSAEHLQTYAVDAPFLVAQVLPLAAEDADTYTLARLRLLAHPDRLDPAEVTDGSVRVQLDERVRTDEGFEGHRLRFDLDLEGGDTVTVEHFAALAPDRATVYRVRVACRQACFQRNAHEIDEVFDSIDLDA